jgi:hypothetical protein
MKKIIVFALISYINVCIFSQDSIPKDWRTNVVGLNYKIKENYKIDTLNIVIRYGENYPQEIRVKIDKLVDSITKNEKYSNLAFKLTSNEFDTTNSIIFYLIDLKYGTKRQNYYHTALDIVLVPLMVVSVVSGTIFFYYYILTPHIKSNAFVYFTEDILSRAYYKKTAIAASSFWVDKAEQEKRYLKSLEKYINYYVLRTERNYLKN